MLKIYFSQHLQACMASFGDILRSPFTNLVIVMVIGIALAFPAGLYTILQNAKQLSHQWDKSSQILLYLKTNTDETTIDSLIRQWSQNPDVSNIKYISPQQGLIDFQQDSGFGDILKELKENPLPPVLVVTPKNAFDSEMMAHLLNTFNKNTQVDIAQLDMAWINRFSSMMHLLQRFIDILSILLGMGVLFIIGSTIHLAIQNRRKEIEVLKLIGATPSFVRRPFLYIGILYGLLGGLLAWLLVLFVFLWLKSSIFHIAQMYGTVLHIHSLNFTSGMSLVGLAMLLGLLASCIVIHRQLFSKGEFQ